MPTQSKIHSPVKSSHKKHQHRTARASTEAYDKDWRKLRKLVLCDEPLCRICLNKRPSQIVPATQVDHIRPLSAGGARLDRNNLQSLCHSCHSRKTAAEDSPAVHRPHWLQKSAIPCTIVCGAPASGRLAYCQKQMTDDDILIDLTQIQAEITGLALHQGTKADQKAALRERNIRLAELSKAPKGKRAWIILQEPAHARRQFWIDTLGAEVVVIETSPHDCIHRIEADPLRTDVVVDQVAQVRRWWKAYTSNPATDTVIRQG